MSSVFVSVGMTLDGFIAPEENSGDPPGDDWWERWTSLHGWVFRQRFFRENLQLGEGGEMGADNAYLEATFERTGASIMGKRMFDAGEKGWPEEAPFHTPVFVLTHEVRSPWERPGGTTFYFVNDGIEAALTRARQAAGDRDVRIAGGADAIHQYLNAGLVDEISISVTPHLFGKGRPLFGGVDPDRLRLRTAEVLHSPDVTHLRYAVRRATASA